MPGKSPWFLSLYEEKGTSCFFALLRKGKRGAGPGPFLDRIKRSSPARHARVRRGAERNGAQIRLTAELARLRRDAKHAEKKLIAFGERQERKQGRSKMHEGQEAGSILLRQRLWRTGLPGKSRCDRSRAKSSRRFSIIKNGDRQIMLVGEVQGSKVQG